MGLLNGKVAIVTGAGHGIGRGHALELAAQGATVVVNDLGSSVTGEGAGRDADLTVAIIEERGGTAVANYDDIADFDGAAGVVNQAVDTYGKLDILVNNAGIVRDAMVFNLSEADWDAVIRVHLKGTFAPTHHAANHWRARHKAGEAVTGRIINTTSGAGLSGNVGQASYTAAKAGIVGFTLTCSLELARLGVTVNCIAPGGATRIERDHPRVRGAEGTGPVRGIRRARPVDELAGRRLARERRSRARHRTSASRDRRNVDPDGGLALRTHAPERGHALGRHEGRPADQRAPLPLTRARPSGLIARPSGARRSI